MSVRPATTFSARNAMREMKKARATSGAGMLRPKSTASSRPRTVLQSAATVMPNVVVFTPPPVPPGEAPMNISAIIRNSVGSRAAPTLIVLKPAVRVLPDWKDDAISAWAAGSSPSVAGLRHSSA